MPWKKFKEGAKWIVKKIDADGHPIGEPLGTHDTEADAAAQVRALYANEPGAKAVKFAPESEVEISGLLAPNGGPFNGADIVGERFSARTDFCLEWFPTDRPLLWHHGLDPKTGASVVGRIKTVSQDDLGLWMQAQLDANHEYYSAIKELIKQSKLGLSSGSMRHLVDVNHKTGEILRWPLIEGSLTPTPANPLAEVDFVAAKSHFAAIGVDIPDLDALKANLTSKQRESLTDADYAYIDSEGGRHLPMQDAVHARNALARFDQTTFENDAAKEKARKKLDARCKELGVEVSPQQATKAVCWEDIRSELGALCQKRLNWGLSPEEASYCWVKETYGDHCIVEVNRLGAERYYSVPFTLGEDGHVAELGEPIEVEETYIPKAPPAMPMSILAETVRSYVATLAERTKDLHERRVKEGRMLSTSNRQKLVDCVSAMSEASGVLQELLNASEPKAKADVGKLRRDAEYLELFALTF